MEVIAYIAGTLTTFAFIPQVTRTFCNRSAADLSWWWLSMSVVGILLWLLYGVTIKNYPLIFFNVITLGLISSLTVASGALKGAGRRWRLSWRRSEDSFFYHVGAGSSPRCTCFAGWSPLLHKPNHI